MNDPDLHIAILCGNFNGINFTAELLNSPATNPMFNIVPVGITVAFDLASHGSGLDRLTANNNELGSQITAPTLNRILNNRDHDVMTIHTVDRFEEITMPLNGESVAFRLAKTARGRALLNFDNYALGSKIDAQALNSIVTQGKDAGYSVALLLATNPAGLELLCANNYALGLKISPENLNTTVRQGPLAGRSVGAILAGSAAGRALLNADDGRLLRACNPALFCNVLQKNNEANLGLNMNAAAAQQYLDANFNYFADGNKHFDIEVLAQVVTYFNTNCRGSNSFKELALAYNARITKLKEFLDREWQRSRVICSNAIDANEPVEENSSATSSGTKRLKM